MFRLHSSLFINVLLPCILCYSITASLNQVNLLLLSTIDQEIILTTTAGGLLGATYLLFFGLAQIPLGILLDNVHPWRIQ